MLVMAIDAGYQKITTGTVDMRSSIRWYWRTQLAVVMFLVGLAVFQLVKLHRAQSAGAELTRAAEAGKRGDFGMAARLCSDAIATGVLSDRQLELAYRLRGYAYGQMPDYARALSDFESALQLDSNDFAALAGRGAAYQTLGKYDLALSDYNNVIRIKKDNPEFYVIRGNLLTLLHRYDDAIADFGHALDIKPNLESALNGRGLTGFYAGHFADAETDFRAASNRDTTNAYYVLWLYLAVEREQKEGEAELASRSLKLDKAKWPGPVVTFYLGRLPETGLRTAAGKGDSKSRSGQLCETAFYLGEKFLLSGNTQAARASLSEADAKCDKNFIELQGAQAELSRLPS